MTRQWGIARGAASGLAALLAVILLAGCSGVRSGNSIAQASVRAVADSLGEAMTPPVIHARDADYLVATLVPSANQASGDTGTGRSIVVEALAFSGNSSDKHGAQIDLRIRVDVPASNSSSFGGESNDAGSATTCFHFDIVGYRFYDNLSLTEIDCPGTDFVVPPLPTDVALPALPPDARERLTAVLQAATAQSLAADVAAEFDLPDTVTETAVDGVRLLASVSVPAERDCIVAAREADGTIEFGSFDRAWIEPGETGCTPALILRPPQ